MPYTVEKLPDAPIVLLVRERSEALVELPAMIEAVEKMLDTVTEPVFLVLDISSMALGIDDLTSAASSGARGPRSVMHHPKIRENLVVSEQTLVKLAMQGLRTATFGNTKIRVFDKQEQALEYCYEQLGLQQGQDQDAQSKAS